MKYFKWGRTLVEYIPEEKLYKSRFWWIDLLREAESESNTVGFRPDLY